MGSPWICSWCSQDFGIRRGRYEDHVTKAVQVRCDVCSQQFCNDNRLQQHIRTTHSGGALDQQQVIPEDKLNKPICPETGYSETPDYLECIDKHYRKIHSNVTHEKNWKRVNRQISPDFTYRDLKNLLEDIQRNEHNVFRINLGFSSILYDTVSGEYRYFYVSSNHLLFDTAFTISNNADIDAFFDKIVSLDLLNTYYLKRPTSGWVLVGLPNIETYIYRMRGVPIGTSTTLPEHIKKSKSIIGLTHHKTKGYAYNDKLCLFRCLALHFGASQRCLEKEAKMFREQLENHTGKSHEDGVEKGMLANVEICFRVAINVYSLQEDRSAIVVRLSNLNYKVMHLNLYKNHFSFVSKFKSYAKKYTCVTCNRIFNHVNSLNRHAKECTTEITEKYVGGKYSLKKSLFEKLDYIDIHVPEEDRYDPYIACYDFEALQVRVQDEYRGLQIHYEHVPATASICSNVPGHTDAVHIRSYGDTQDLVDSFVHELVKIQQTRENEMLKKYQPYINELEKRIMGIEEKLGLNKKKQGVKRDSTGKVKEDKELLDDEATLSGGEDSEDEEDCSDIENLIDDTSDVEENDVSFYQAFDNTHPPTQRPAIQPTTSNRVTPEQELVEKKKLKKTTSLKTKLVSYAKQLTVLGFNSQRYDLQLIREYLPSSLIKIKETPKQVIKKTSSYMVISTDKLKFLDILNYLAPGTSLAQFYASYGVSVAKGSFPYTWFDSLEKMEATSLPPIKEFHSILKDKDLTPKEYDICAQTWKQEGMTKFEDFVRYYNNNDVIGFVEAVEKMLENEKANKLDMFKESVSLPGLTQRYLMRRLEKGDYFVGFGKEHKHLSKLLRQNIVGGPSIIFHRYHEKDVTYIKNKHLCKSVVGFDANSLYLYCQGQKMPTGYYVLREEKNGYIPQTPYSHEAIQWLEYMANKDGVHIQHAENGGEERIENYSVDGFDKVNNVIYEYNGCFHHKHFCHDGYSPDVWEKTIEKENFLRSRGYNVVSITSCEWLKQPESKEWYSTPTDNPTRLSMENILQAIKSGKLFGFAKVDIHVPEELISYFSEFPPIFKNTEISMNDIGEHMQAFCKSIERKDCVKRSLISSMHGEGILLLTPLLKKYLEMGLIVTRIEHVIAYNGKPVFDWFPKEVADDRRRADVGGEALKMKGEASKLKGNCSYGHTLMDKSKHTRLTFTTDKNLPRHVKNPLLKHLDPLNGDVYEVEKQKKSIIHDLPLQIGVAVYSYAKLRMLEFWEFLKTYLDNDMYQLMEMDTDSLYIAFASENIDECVKLELRTKWNKEKWNFFSSDDYETMIDFDNEKIPLAQWDKRTPGKFKAEYIGIGMICLNSKVYIVWGGVDRSGEPMDKLSCKGANKDRNKLVKKHFLTLLRERKIDPITNAGFIKNKDGKFLTYTQKKKAMNYFYAKREVLDDGVSTTHLKV